MAWHKYPKYLRTSDAAGYDTLFIAGGGAPFAGIYRCEGCGREVARAQSHPLPMPNHHPHKPEQGDIRWRLIVYADHEPSSA